MVYITGDIHGAPHRIVNFAKDIRISRNDILCHYYIPFYIGYRYQAIHLHGHSHNTEEHEQEELIKQQLAQNGFETRSYNVGCMHWNYEPVTLDEILGYKTL